MSKLSLHAVDQMYRNNSEDPVLMLLELTFPNSTTYYYVNNTEDITSNGQVYTAFPFAFTLPNEEIETEPELSITLSNVGLDLIDDFRSNVQDITAKVKVVFASVPDFVEIGIDSLEVKSISYNEATISVMLGYQDILNTKIPSYSYTPVDFPGLYNA